jgi:hypothetical protein
MRINGIDTTSIAKISGIAIASIIKIAGVTLPSPPPGIITAGLVMYLDASIPASYPGTGTAWDDISGNHNSGTLTNGPTYTSSDGGAIIFDGADDYVDFPTTSLSSTGDITICTFLKLDGVQNSYANILDYEHATYNGFVIQQDAGTGPNYFYFAWSNGGGFDFCNFQVPIDNTYFNLTITKIGGTVTTYINGVALYVGYGVSTLVGTGNRVRIAANASGHGRQIKGTIGDFLIYDAGLTSIEVLQNFNALKTRFGY